MDEGWMFNVMFRDFGLQICIVAVSHWKPQADEDSGSFCKSRGKRAGLTNAVAACFDQKGLNIS